ALQGQEQARAPQGSQPLPRQAPRPRRTSQRPAQALEDPDQATLLPTPSRSPGQGHPRPPEPRAQPTLKKVHYVLAVEEMEAWLLLFPDALSDLVGSWKLPAKYRGKDTGRLTDPKGILMREVSKGGRRYRESDAPAVL